MKESFKWKYAVFALISFLILIVFDQWTKSLAVAYLMDKDPFIIIKNVFQLRYLENRGAAFGMMQGQQTFFLITGVIAVVILAYIYFKLPWTKRFVPLRAVALLIASGAVGNMIDRVTLGYVVDFFYFELIDFPIFNVADIYVTCATIVLALLILFYYKDEELDCLFPKKKEKN